MTALEQNKPASYAQHWFMLAIDATLQKRNPERLPYCYLPIHNEVGLNKIEDLHFDNNHGFKDVLHIETEKEMRMCRYYSFPPLKKTHRHNNFRMGSPQSIS